MENKNNDQLALAITKALGYAENGGKPDLKNTKSGKSGEMKSIFQFTPNTWKLYSKQVLGQDNVPLNNDSESFVVHKKVSDWLGQGYSPEQIASMWNAGERQPDAYKENWKGTNKQGVTYDTPAYAKKVADYTKQFMQEGIKTPVSQQEMATNTLGQSSQKPDNQALLNHLVELTKSVKSNSIATGSPGLVKTT